MLNISNKPNTADTHTRNFYKKTRIKNVMQLVQISCMSVTDIRPAGLQYNAVKQPSAFDFDTGRPPAPRQISRTKSSFARMPTMLPPGESIYNFIYDLKFQFYSSNDT